MPEIKVGQRVLLLGCVERIECYDGELTAIVKIPRGGRSEPPALVPIYFDSLRNIEPVAWADTEPRPSFLMEEWP